MRLVVIPGMGADHRLVEPLRAAFGNLYVPAWIEPERAESLPHYALRLAELIPPSDEPLLLAGVSLGGMLAQEMAPRFKPRAVVLIASCRDPRALWKPLYQLARFARWTPLAGYRAAKLLAPWYAHKMHLVSPEQMPMLLDMVRQSDPAFLRWGCHAVRSWRPTPLDTPVYHIHGTRDRLFPAANVSPQAWVSGGGHLISLTHADQVNEFLRQVAHQCDAQEQAPH